ncbi:MAG: type II toxin-antitoxin system VapC family toxin [Candidatus Heimdallarchaeota archaeon]
MTLQIIIDSNILLLTAEGRFNLHAEIERLVPQKHRLIFLISCVEELDLVAKKSRKLASRVRLAKEITTKLEIIDDENKSQKFVDDKILEYASANQPCVVVTNDKELKMKVRKQQIPVIFVKTKSHLELLGTIF